jgi:hypothetical protein
MFTALQIENDKIQTDIDFEITRDLFLWTTITKYKMFRIKRNNNSNNKPSYMHRVSLVYNVQVVH